MNNLRRPRKNILTRDKAHELLQPFYDDLVEIMQKGLNKFMTLPDDLRDRARPRTLANVLNDCICREAVDRFDKETLVRVVDDWEGYLFVFHEQAVLRFKKVSSTLRPSNVPTGRQVDIGWQQCEIDGVETPTLVNVGYEPNVIFTEIKTCGLSCRKGESVLWVIPLVDDMQAFLLDNGGNVVTPTSGPVVRPKLTGKAANG
jgi:hypothetical protein